jgi:hypothetical protein
MSDELQFHRKGYLGAPRKLTPEEEKLLREMLKYGDGSDGFIGRLDNVIVQPMDDGGMGSLYFQSERKSERKLGRSIVEVEFIDRDGVLVSAVVNVDDLNELFELDIWKVDFSRLIAFPDPQKIVVKPRQPIANK